MGKYDALFAEDSPVPSKYAGLFDSGPATPGKDVGQSARRAQAGMAPGPREYTDEELDAQDKGRQRLPEFMRAPGIAHGPETRERFTTFAKRVGLYDPPRSMEQQSFHDYQASRGELGSDPAAQEVVKTVLSAGAGSLARLGGRAASTMLGRVASGVTSGAAAGGTASGLSGGDVSEGALKGALMGGATSAVPEILNAGARGVQKGAADLRAHLRDPRTEIGRSIAEMDKAKASGYLTDPKFQALPYGAPGFNQAAAEAEQNIAAHNDQFLRSEGDFYKGEQNRIFSESADRLHYIPDSEEALNTLQAENTVNGVVADEKLGEAIDKVKRMLTTDTGVVSGGAVPEAIKDSAVPTVETITAPAVKVSDLVKTKRLVDGLAEYGMPATPENVPYRKLSGILGKELEGISPEMAGLNKRYAAAMGKVEDANAIMYGKDAARISRTPAKQRQAASFLGRIGDNTQAATGAAAQQIEELRALDPAYAREIDRVAAKKAVERTRFGMPTVSRRIEHMPLAFVKQNMDALAVKAVDPALQSIASASPLSIPTPTPESIAFMLWAAQQQQKNKRSAAITGGQ